MAKTTQAVVVKSPSLTCKSEDHVGVELTDRQRLAFLQIQMDEKDHENRYA